MSFTSEIKIHFDEADPAGIAFSGGVFTKIHRCYEDFIGALDEDPKEFFLNPSWIYPIRHMEADYRKPLLPLEHYQVQISVLKISESSFQLLFDISQNDRSHCQVRSLHVCVNKETMEKAPLPSSLKLNLEKFVIPQ